jgi:hypothetical protein
MIYDESHGSPYDRGSADAYYRRNAKPHYYPNGSYVGDPVTELTPKQLEAYTAGYNDQVASGDFKDCGE